MERSRKIEKKGYPEEKEKAAVAAYDISINCRLR
jgi:hypothetical protein